MRKDRFMKSIISALGVLFILGVLFQPYSENNREYLMASEHLEQLGEVYFRFSVNTQHEIDQLSDVISIDNVRGTEVLAFANKQEFENFLKYDHYYNVLTPPCWVGPKPEMSDYKHGPDWTKYPTFDGYVNMMYQFATDYPGFVSVEEIGKSVNGRELLVAKVSDNVEIEESEPEWFLVGATHGNETMGSMLSMRLIEWLCENHTRDSRAHRILDSIELYILPFTNPDGTYRGGNSNIFDAVRYNANNVDLNRNWPKVPGAGQSATPEQETKVVMAWEQEHHVVMNMDYHAGVETAIYPYSAVQRRTTDDAWWQYVCRIYADLAQEDGPSGYYNDCVNGICNGYQDLGYVAQGTTKDWFYYFLHARGISNELTNTKLVSEGSMQGHWESNLNATLAYLQEALNGIRGTVVDEVTKVGKQAKIWVEDHDVESDSSFVYADSAGGHGNYYRPIIEGTYSVTYSCTGCTPKKVDNITVVNGQATIVNVELDCGSTGTNDTYQKMSDQISIISNTRGIRVNFGALKGIVKAYVYDVTGRLIKTLPLQAGSNNILWNGLSNNSKKAGSGCYVLQVQTGDKKFSQPFVLSN